jgi:alginate O-acetyltransferase complex protein AlgJ
MSNRNKIKGSLGSNLLLLGRHNLLTLLLFLILFPAILFFLKILFGIHKLPKKLRPDYKLYGIVNSLERPIFDIAHFKSHDIQTYLEDFLVRKLPLRSAFIRVTNQIYYTFFDKSYSSRDIIIGKNHQLFEKGYISGYCGQIAADLNNDVKLQAWANHIQNLYTYFSNRGKTFVYIISPSKVEYMPDAIPCRYHCEKRGMSDHIKKFTTLLDERNIPYVNGPLLMKQATKLYGVSMFNRGGTHWNNLAASVAANEIIKKINNQGHVHLSTLHFQYKMRKPKLEDVECDLLALANLLHPHRDYFVPRVNIQPVKNNTPPQSISIVGSSFSGGIFHVFKDNKFSPIINYFYYLKLAHHAYKQGHYEEKDHVDLSQAIKEINTSTIILFEENSINIMSSYGQAFYELLRACHKIT